MNNEQQHGDLDIAVVGIAGRFPGASNINEFWENLVHGVESIAFHSEKDVIDSGVHPEMARDPDFVAAAGALEGEYLFDAEFFDVNPREAEIMDPQQRIFLETAWEALESAGYNPEACPGKVAVYAGASINTYLLFHIIPNRRLLESVGHFQVMTAADKDFLATRIAYKLNLKGAAITVQTACSTSLVALDLACQSLLNYQADMALAGGVSITPKGRLYKESFIFSKDGHCRAFDENAEGTVGGNGAGLVVLKRLEDALADGDHIHAIIKASAVNNDGSLKVGYTAPSVSGQADVITEALGRSGVEAESIGYVEAHGTGTLLGDPIEIAALTQAYRTQTDKKNFCAIGSVKTNIGHLDTAAGISGLIKAILTLENKQIAPSLNFKTVNPKLKLEESPFFVNDRLSEWPSNGKPRRAAVSSFGFGGTNAHAILEEAPSFEPSTSKREWQLLPVSARNEGALKDNLGNLGDYLEKAKPAHLADVAFTLQTGRKAFSQRAFVVANTAEAAGTLLSKRPKTIKATDNPLVAFMFPGQGSQFVNMAREFYVGEPVFAENLRACAKWMRPHLDRDILEVIYPDSAHAAEAEALIGQTQYTQPALFAIEYALAQLWISWTGQPQALIGHSIGEYVAACIAGVFSLEHAAEIVCLRGRLIQAQPKGAMLSVPLSEEELTPLLPAELSLAVFNAPKLCVVSGPHSAIERFNDELSARSIEARQLNVSHAFHSSMMEGAADQCRAVFAKATFAEPTIPFISNVTGEWITPAQACDPNYWADHLRQPVRFHQGLQLLLKMKPAVLLEVGPGQVLGTLARQQRELVGSCAVLASTRHPQTSVSDYTVLLQAAGTLWANGVSLNWDLLHAGESRRRLPLPTYSFQRKLFFLPPMHGTNTTLELADSTVVEEARSSDLERSESMPNEYEAPTNVEEALIADIWQKMLGIKQIGIHDDFFVLGGHSLLATQLVAEVRRGTHSQISVQALFEEPTIAGLAKRVRSLNESGDAAPLLEIEPIPRDGYLPLTFHQESVWDFETTMPGTTRFNGFITVALRGKLKEEGLRFAMNEILRRHEVLRTTYAKSPDGRPTAVIHPSVPLDLPKVDLSSMPVEERDAELLRIANQLVQRSFDIYSDLFIRPMLVRLSDEEHLMCFASHYVAVDGWTIGLVIQELGEHYSAFVESRTSHLPELTFQCVDYAHWQRSTVTPEIVAEQLPYWREQLLDVPPQELLQTDRPRPAEFTLRGSVFHFGLDRQMTDALKEFSHTHGSTTFMTLVAALNVLFHARSNSKDIVIGTITGDREIGMESLIGAYVNCLALRTEVDPGDTYLELLDKVKQVATNAYAHQIPFAVIAQSLAAERDLMKNPLFRVMFVLRNVPMTETKATDLDIQLTSIPIDRGVSDQDLSLYLQEKAGALGGYFEYNTDLFDRDTMAQLAADFVTLLRSILESPTAHLRSLLPSADLIEAGEVQTV